MYTAYQPLFPAASRYLQEKWDKTNYREHLRKVELAIPVVHTTAVATPLHLLMNPKKMQLEKERQAVRDRANLLQYTRLGGIGQSQGRVDNWNFYHRRSLKCKKRQQDLQQIYRENQLLMRRLEGKKSQLAQERWQRDWHREQKIRNRLARYPRATRSCQAGAERWRQRTGCSSRPTSACGKRSPSSSPDGVCFPSSSSRSGVTDKRSCNKPALQGPGSTSAFLLSLSRKRDVAQQSSKGTLVSAKGFATKDADGSLARADMPGGAFLEKPLVETVTPRTKTLPSICLREKLRISVKIPMPASKGLEKKHESSPKYTEPYCGKTKEGSTFDP